MNRSWVRLLLAGLLAGTDDGITAAIASLPSAQRVRLARLLAGAIEDAIIRHSRQDPAVPAVLFIDEISTIAPDDKRRAALRDTGLRVPGKSNVAGALLDEELRGRRQQ